MSDANSFPPLQLLPFRRDFYLPSARVVAPRLLGHYLLRVTPEGVMGGVVVEAEAYLHNDPACHAFAGPTARNRSMFGAPGRAYVYFIYGMHQCFNAVCGPEGRGEAVLIRALEATHGFELMQQRRPTRRVIDLTRGPAKLCQALGIDRSLDGVDLCSAESPVWIAENPARRSLLRRLGPIQRTPRIGISRAADLPLRFLLSRSEWVSHRHS
ncbi:MAG: DNA-3-methyladenine glycosylase [Verrucomicrobiales bacterium]|nr:DNA-3-methyladenine glycosylase [Verrucomicrobiales bacterium]